MAGVMVVGTDTGVGKTWVTGAMVGLLRSVGVDAFAWKPVQSGSAPGDPEADSARLKWLGGLEEPEELICPATLAEPLAPALAARRAGVVLDPARWRDLLAGWIRRREMVFVEGAGGIAVPLADGYTVADLAADAGIPLLLVARAGLGTVNHIVLTVAYARQRGLRVKGLILNGYGKEGESPAERTNPDLIRASTDVPILGRVPWIPDRPDREAILAEVRNHVDLGALLKIFQGGHAT